MRERETGQGELGKGPKDEQNYSIAYVGQGKMGKGLAILYGAIVKRSVIKLGVPFKFADLQLKQKQDKPTDGKLIENWGHQRRQCKGKTRAEVAK